MAHSDAIESYIYSKIEKLKKFFKREPNPIYIDIVLEPHREKNFFKVEFKLHSFHYHIVIKTEGFDMYTIIDEAVYKMIKEIIRKKDKMGHEFRLVYTV